MGKTHASKAVAELWPALQEGTPEAIHRVRKLTRRVQAELRVAGAGRKQNRAWQALRQQVAPVRDRDATGAHLTTALSELQVPAAQIEIFGMQWAAARQRAFRELEFADPPPPLHRPDHWKRRVRAVLDHDRKRLLRRGPEVLGGAKPAEWHRLRKRLKRYRYTLELLDDPPQPLLDTLDALGRVQDAEVVSHLLREEDWLPEWRERLLEREAAAQTQARERVRHLWPALAATLTEH